ncbi:hypothetical protein pb186bvf_016138 [Paramecium bursaria]
MKKFSIKQPLTFQKSIPNYIKFFLCQYCQTSQVNIQILKNISEILTFYVKQLEKLYD